MGKGEEGEGLDGKEEWVREVKNIYKGLFEKSPEKQEGRKRCIFPRGL